MVASPKLGSLRLRAVGLSLSPPIDARLDQLWTVARTGGQPTTRQEIVAALILAADPDPLSIGQLLNRYRDSDVASARIAGVPWAGPDTPKRPGRRKLKAASR